MSINEFSFELITQDEKARLGKINTPRGVINTGDSGGELTINEEMWV